MLYLAKPDGVEDTFVVELVLKFNNLGMETKSCGNIMGAIYASTK